MGIYSTSNSIKVTIVGSAGDTAGKGFYAPDGSVRVTLVTGDFYVGRYAPDGSINVTLSTAGVGIYHPSGAIRGTNIISGATGLYSPNGGYYFDGLATASELLLGFTEPDGFTIDFLSNTYTIRDSLGSEGLLYTETVGFGLDFTDNTYTVKGP
jgi:hypothetical protein